MTMETVLQLLGSVEFWFGAVLLLVYQVGRFSELGGADPALAERMPAIPNLRASDFAGPSPFYCTLAAFLIATFVVYLSLCLVSPSVIHGWINIAGGGDNGASAVDVTTYPLYIAATFMGLTQSVVPGFATLAEMQRSFFHFWIGVPRSVVETAAYFSDQILNRPAAATSEGLIAEVENLSGEALRTRMARYADTAFLRDQIHRLRLDDPDSAEQSALASRRELKLLIESLVYAAAIAAARKGGRRALYRLADDLGVERPRREASAQPLVAGMMLFVVGLTIGWFALPMLQPLASALLGEAGVPFWPTELATSLQYMVSQFVPLFLGVGLMLFMWPENTAGTPEARDAPLWKFSEITQHYWPFITIFVAIILFDFSQQLYDFGYFDGTAQGGVWAFLSAFLPYNVLHAIIISVACYYMIAFFGRRGREAGRRELLSSLLVLNLIVMVLSGFWMKARVFFMFPGQAGTDLLILTILIHMLAISLAFAATLLFFRGTASRLMPEGRGGRAHAARRRQAAAA